MDTKEKRLLEAFASYESGESLATLQAVYADVAVELNQMVEAERMLKEGKLQMRPSPELGRRVVAALSERRRQYQTSVFMSGFWRLAAPVGIAALSFMFVLAGQHAERSGLGTDAADMFAVKEAAPMMAMKISAPAEERATVSLMAIAPTEDAAAPENARLVENDLMVAQSAPDSDSLYRWQMIALGLLALLSLLVFFKHLRLRTLVRNR